MKKLLVLVLGFALLFGCLQPDNSTPSPSVVPIVTPSVSVTLKEMRSDYGLSKEVFAELPAIPKNFTEINLMVSIGKLSDMNRIKEAYWKQPEFIPNWDKQGLPLYQNPPKDRWGGFGYGTYPSETLVNSPRNASWNVSFFLHTSWIVETYQGIGLFVAFPTNARLIQNNFPDGVKNITQDPAKVKQYFDVVITPQSLLLEPAYPVFKSNWTQRVTIKVKAKNVPPGRYAIALDVGAPTAELRQAWMEQYLLMYADNAGLTGIGRPYYTLFVEVT